MALFTKGQFQEIAQGSAGIRGLRGVVNEMRSFAKSTSTTSIFLSHAHNDKAIVEQAKLFFENLGISVYVDWADQTMPESSNGVTAARIKGQIYNNDKFIFLATNNAIASRWCNWEIGIGDTYKLHANKIAVLPLTESNGTWSGNEYLQIYPHIERGTTPNDYKVLQPNNTSESLTTWLRR